MADMSIFNAAFGAYKIAGPNLLFTPSSGIRIAGKSSGDAGTTLIFNAEKWWQADQISLDGGSTQTSFSVVSAGTFTPAEQNSNFFNNYPQFSPENPPTYAVIEVSSGEQLMFFPDFPEIEGDFDGTVFLLEEGIIPCFTPGTFIATPDGERLVEDLRVGDRIITRDNGLQEIRWVGRRDLTGPELMAAPHLKPILIPAGSLGDGLPERDIMASPQHRVLINNKRSALYFEDREVLAAAKHLTSVKGVTRVEVSAVSYIHFMFDQHEVVLSNGIWTESFQPGEQVLDGMGRAHRNELFELFPELARSDGLKAYKAARRALKKHETRLLVN
ncbi:Hint domain-containing protein [Roseovarius aestuariivivens]|uniref:Hint domain-containing protein n=1 Tax=Roseovarius aestuariivivens TaxID=1888910 RepID=UPI003159BEB5